MSDITRIIIESDNEHQTGWLLYVLGFDKDPAWSATQQDGWDTGKETTSLAMTNYVMRRMQNPPTAFPIKVIVEEAGLVES